MSFSRQPNLSDPTTSFEGRTIVITGSNTGLGLAAAQKFASLNASRLILAVRDVSKGLAASSLIKSQHPASSPASPQTKIEVWQLDMDSYPSITSFAQKIGELERLDIAILNAGVYMPKYEVGSYGWEKTLQINVLGTAYLGLLLLPKLKDTFRKFGGEVPVLEFVSSTNHRRVQWGEERRKGDVLLGAYNRKEIFVARDQYAFSKLAVMYVMQTLAGFAKSKEGIETVVMACCPGYAKSDLSRGLGYGVLTRLMRWLANTFMLRNTEEGARTLVSGVSLGEKAHGGWWKDDVLQS